MQLERGASVSPVGWRRAESPAAQLRETEEERRRGRDGELSPIWVDI